MHIVIVGAGRIGGSLGRWLISAGHEIAVVEWERSRCSALDEALGSITVLGDGSDAGALANAGTNRADVLIATTRKDDINLAACQLAKHHFNVARTISVVNVRDHAELFGILGVDVSIDVTEMVLGRIEEGLSHRGLVHLMPVSDMDGKSVVSFKIRSRFGSKGRRIRDISLPDGTIVPLVISREGEASIPTDSTVIREGDEVIVVATAQAEEHLRDLLIEEIEE